MKCIMCDGKLIQKKVEHEEFGVSLGKFEAQVCSKCNEVYFDSEIVNKIQTKSKKLGLFGLVKKTKVAKVGNSLAVRIPKEIVDFTRLKKEGSVKVFPRGRKEIIIEL